MSLGAILVGIAVTTIIIAYIARPFRRTTVDYDTVIETWVAKLSAVATATPPLPDALAQTNFCPQCGRRIAPDHRFCPGCGYRLPREEGDA